MKELLKQNYQLLLGITIFIVILYTKTEFYKAIILLLEFIVVLEIIKMTTDFLKKDKLSLRYIIDIFIIFLIRDIVILITEKDYNKEKIILLLGVVSSFFIFRIMAIKFSPILYKKKNISSLKNNK